MQKIFYNGKIISSEQKVDEAMLVNNGVIVLTGTNDEILEMKDDGTEVVDLLQNFVYPTFFQSASKIFVEIENRLKNANEIDLSENDADNDENYEKFSNFNAYKDIFLEIQEEFISKGVVTVQELGLSKRAFTFWKKIADDGYLKIDVIGYVDIKNSKQVMDENCRSYRKYRNHFRLGGYYLAIDGKIQDAKAWLSKPYKHSKYYGFSDCYSEQLSCIIKMAFEEKKQLYVETNGDKALTEFISVFEEVKIKEKVEDTFRPIVYGCNILNKKHIEKMKELSISPCFDVSSLRLFGDSIKKLIGHIRMKHFLNILAVSEQLKFLLCDSNSLVANNLEIIDICKNRKTQKDKTLNKKQCVNVKLVLKSLYEYASFLSFDQEEKGTLENGKQASFFVLKKELEDIGYQSFENEIQGVYLAGEKCK